jgi:hypothetical protein
MIADYKFAPLIVTWESSFEHFYSEKREPLLERLIEDVRRSISPWSKPVFSRVL